MTTFRRIIIPGLLALSLLGTSASSAAAKTYHWNGLQIKMSQRNAKIFINRLSQTHWMFRKLVAKASRRSHVVVLVSGKNAPSGGNYTATRIDSQGTEFEIGLNPRNFKLGNKLGYHLEAHELSHLVANSFVDTDVYATYFSVWNQSSSWNDCFPQKSPPALAPCVGEDEIFADQIAFWATGKSKVRSSYKLPPLASRSNMTRLVRSSGLWRNAGLR